MTTIDKLGALLALIQDEKSATPVAQSNDPTGQHICVLDRGFVYVGEISWSGDWLTIANARNIRVWGTNNGLGELRNGPTGETKLDACGTVMVMRSGVKHLIPCKGF